LKARAPVPVEAAPEPALPLCPSAAMLQQPPGKPDSGPLPAPESALPAAQWPVPVEKWRARSPKALVPPGERFAHFGEWFVHSLIGLRHCPAGLVHSAASRAHSVGSAVGSAVGPVDSAASAAGVGGRGRAARAHGVYSGAPTSTTPCCSDRGASPLRNWRGATHGVMLRKNFQIISVAFTAADGGPARRGFSCARPPGQWCPNPSTVTASNVTGPG
jgi:hypothetical protein